MKKNKIVAIACHGIGHLMCADKFVVKGLTVIPKDTEIVEEKKPLFKSSDLFDFGKKYKSIPTENKSKFIGKPNKNYKTR